MRRRLRKNCANSRAAALRAACLSLSVAVVLPIATRDSVDQLGLFTAPATAFIVWGLFGLREIGTLIENPFTRSLQLQIVSDTLAFSWTSNPPSTRAGIGRGGRVPDTTRDCRAPPVGWKNAVPRRGSRPPPARCRRAAGHWK